MPALKELGELRSGYVARAGLMDCGGRARVRALQARDVTPNGSIAWASLRCVKDIPAPERYCVREGDLLVPTRAVRMAAFVPHDVPSGVVAVGHWGILTPDPARVDAGYLAWYLNHPATWPRLQAAMSGSSLPFLSMGALREFEVELVSLVLQRRIARTKALNARITNMEAQLAEARRRLVNHITMAAVREEHGHSPESE